MRLACSAGEPLNPEAIAWWNRTVGCPVLDYYGLSESYPLCGNYPTVEVRPGSMGLPLPGWEVAILDPDEQPVPQGEPGEICLKARSNPHYPLGYWNRPEDSKEVFGGDWFHTKDTARQDEDGYVWYSGRADDVIISAGYRIGPFEVESTLLEHPAVAESAVVASPDPQRGHVVKAFVRLVPGTEPGDELVGELQRPRPRAPVRLRLPAQGRVRRRPAQDPHRQDPPLGAAQGRRRGRTGTARVEPGVGRGVASGAMYDTRWPRPGPAMAAVAAVLGLVAGAILGLSSPGSAPQAQARAPVETTVAPTTTTLPEEFDTVVLGSYNDRANADARLREVRNQGVEDAGPARPGAVRPGHQVGGLQRPVRDRGRGRGPPAGAAPARRHRELRESR